MTATIHIHTIRLQVFSLSQVTIGRLSIGHIVNFTTMMFSGLSTYIRRYRIGCSTVQYSTYCTTALHTSVCYIVFLLLQAFIHPYIFWIAPVHLVVTLYLIYLELGCSSFVIMVFILLQIPMPISLAKLFSIYRYSSDVCSNWWRSIDPLVNVYTSHSEPNSVRPPYTRQLSGN